MAITFPTNPSDGDTFEGFTYNAAHSVWNSTPGGGSGSSVTAYATLAELPLSGNDTGAMAFVSENSKLYIWDGTGWFNIAITNTAPSITVAPDASYELATDGTPTVITLEATDPEGIPINWSYSVTTGSLGSIATVSQVGNVFTITPSTDENNAGTFGLTFTASDGVNMSSAEATFNLAFAPPYSFQGSNYGYSSGGGLSSANTDVIEKFPFATDANAANVGSLTGARYALTGQSSNDYGYSSGGDSGFDFTIDKFAFASDGNATDVGDSTASKSYIAGQSSAVSGYISGDINIDKFSFSSDGNATDIGDLSVARGQASGQSSSDYGYTSGGTTSVNIIDKFPFSADTNASDVGDLATPRQGTVGQSSADYGYASGGYAHSVSGRVNNIDKFAFASDGNATDVGSLTNTLNLGSGQSSTDYGYVSGGYSTSTGTGLRLATIQKFPFASDANATDVGSLTVANMGTAGQQY